MSQIQQLSTPIKTSVIYFEIQKINTYKFNDLQKKWLMSKAKTDVHFFYFE